MLDFYNLFSGLTTVEKSFWNSVRKFANNPDLVKDLKECNIREESFPRKYIDEMANLGFLGADLKGYGCPGVSSLAYGLLMMELEAKDTALRSFASVHSGLVMHAIFEYGSEAQKARWLPLLRTGQAIGCFGLTESYGGSNPANLLTKAVPHGDFYILDGSKNLITNGSIADVAVVWAKIPSGEIRGFLVEKGTPGFSASPIKSKRELRASVVSLLSFEDNCQIPKENLLPGTEVGLRAALSCLNHARYGITWGTVGAAICCYESALEFAKTRQPFDKPIASHQLTQAKLAYMVKEITKAQLLCLQLAKLRDQKVVTPEQISLAKWNNVNIAIEVARQARTIIAGDGISYEHIIGVHLQNLESVRTYEGTEEIHILSVGREITGFSAFR